MSARAESVSCDYCGLPFKVARVVPDEKVYCCAGCALASRVKNTGDEFPVTPELIVALLAGFAVFNQAMFALLGWLLRGDPDQVTQGERLLWVSLGIGVVAWLLTAAAQWRARGARRRADVVFLAVTVIVLVSGILAQSPLLALGGTMPLLLWSARGWFRTPRVETASRLRS